MMHETELPSVSRKEGEVVEKRATQTAVLLEKQECGRRSRQLLGSGRSSRQPRKQQLPTWHRTLRELGALPSVRPNVLDASILPAC